MQLSKWKATVRAAARNKALDVSAFPLVGRDHSTQQSSSRIYKEVAPRRN